MWRPGNHQNPPKGDFGIILPIFQEFCGKWWNFSEFKENNVFVGILGFLGVQAAQTLILSKEYKGFVKGRGIQKINGFHEISWFSWFFYIFIEILGFQWIS